MAARGFHRVEGFASSGVPPLLFLRNLAPMLPMDVAGLAAGAMRYPAWRYLTLVTVASVLRTAGLLLWPSVVVA